MYVLVYIQCTYSCIYNVPTRVYTMYALVYIQCTYSCIYNVNTVLSMTFHEYFIYKKY